MSDPEDESQWQAEDVISRGYKHDPNFMKLVENTTPVRELEVGAYDALVVAGGQGPMFTFKDATDLHHKFVEFYETGKVTSALCHGTAVLAFATLSNGEPLVTGKTVTGFPNVEEDLADQMTRQAGALGEGQHIMPWRIEDSLNTLGANFIRAGAFRSFAIRDGNLVTGQQNFSGAEVAEKILEAVGAMKVAIIGAGRIGSNIARQLTGAGHEVTLSFARDQQALQQLADEINGNVGSPGDAVAAAELVVLSVPWDAIPEALDQAGPLSGKVVIDTTNQFGSGSRPAQDQTAAAFNAARMPGARYTKSFNTLTSAFQAQVAHRDPRVVQWLAGNDAGGKDDRPPG